MCAPQARKKILETFQDSYSPSAIDVQSQLHHVFVRLRGRRRWRTHVVPAAAAWGCAAVQRCEGLREETDLSEN